MRKSKQREQLLYVLFVCAFLFGLWLPIWISGVELADATYPSAALWAFLTYLVFRKIGELDKQLRAWFVETAQGCVVLVFLFANAVTLQLIIFDVLPLHSLVKTTLLFAVAIVCIFIYVSTLKQGEENER